MWGLSAVRRRAAADTLRLGGFVVTALARSVVSGLVRPVRWTAVARRRLPHRLLIAPQDIRTADPTVAADIYAGYFVFEGMSVNAHGTSPFQLQPPSAAWAEALAGFGWLRHLRAADTSLARVNARALVNDWITHAGKPNAVPGWSPKVVARRVLAWLSQSPLILEGADAAFYRRFMRSLGRQTAILHAALKGGLRGEVRLFVAVALAEFGLCADGFARLERYASRVLTEEIGRQILPDGGHVGRNPGILVELLLDLLPVRQAYAARSTPVPPQLLNAIDRIMPMIRTFRHGDGALALFNGMGATRPEALATVLAYDDSRGGGLTNAPYSGYQRLEGGTTVVVVDTGRPPPADFSRDAHAGTLAFELSVTGQRIIVNCGAPGAGQKAAREAARATAAHSTLVLADQSSCRFASATRFGRWVGAVLYAGPGKVVVRRSDGPGESAIEASHDGYAGLGFLHRRSLALRRDGGRFEGLDRLEPVPASAPGPLPYAIRFHLHPAIRAVLVRSGQGAAVALPTGERWLFEAGELPLAIEESIFFATAEGSRRTEQIVVRGNTGERTEVAWSLTRIEG